jgi:hypothetical protein
MILVLFCVKLKNFLSAGLSRLHTRYKQVKAVDSDVIRKYLLSQGYFKQDIIERTTNL